MNLTTKNIMPLSNSNDLLLIATLFFGRQPEMGVISPPTIDFIGNIRKRLEGYFQPLNLLDSNLPKDACM